MRNQVVLPVPLRPTTAQSSPAPMFKSIGAAIQDIVVAELVLNKAVAAGLAQATPLGFLMKQT